MIILVRRMKRKRMIVVLLILCMTLACIVSGLIIFKNITKEDPIETIQTLNKEEAFDEAFFTWLKKNNEEAFDHYLDSLKENTYKRSNWHEWTGMSYLVLLDHYKHNTPITKVKPTATIDFIGDISLADNWYIAKAYDSRKKNIYGILSKDTASELTGADVTVANNEFTISDRGTPIPGKTYTFRASPKRLSIYQEMGVDLVTLANNHIYDYGKDAFLDALSALDEAGMPHIGAGKDISEAKKPYYTEINGYKIGFLNANRSEKRILTPGATKTDPGVFRCYDPSDLIKTIKKTKKQCDYLVVCLHWGREDSHELENVLKTTSHQYIDAGADALVGTHAHVLQGMEFYKGKLIAYNLGDFIFNHETKQTGILKMSLSNDGKLSYRFIACKQENKYTEIVTGDEAVSVYKTINKYSINVHLTKKGEIKVKE